MEYLALFVEPDDWVWYHWAQYVVVFFVVIQHFRFKKP